MSVDVAPYFKGTATASSTAMSVRSGTIELYGGFSGTVALMRKDPGGAAHAVESVGAYNASALSNGAYIRFDFDKTQDIYLDVSNASGLIQAEMIGERAH